jgi:alginate O-acetyltransferase complex protein AlgI
MLTMLLGGLWHGANWTFVAWGALHGAYLVAEQGTKRWLNLRMFNSRVGRVALMLLTFHLVCVGWVFFRAGSIVQAFQVLGAMSGLAQGGGMAMFSRWSAMLAVACVAALVGVHCVWRDKRIEQTSARVGWLVTALGAGAMLFLTLTAGGRSDAFIYFQF